MEIKFLTMQGKIRTLFKAKLFLWREENIDQYEKAGLQHHYQPW